MLLLFPVLILKLSTTQSKQDPFQVCVMLGKLTLQIGKTAFSSVDLLTF